MHLAFWYVYACARSALFPRRRDGRTPGMVGMARDYWADGGPAPR